ncbi:MAG: hypothetical protein ABSE89_06855 [Sedimentisphaerales bacterium]
MQLMVVKADGSEESYLHTKVIAAIVNALGRPADEISSIASELAEAVTFYLYGKFGRNKISSSEILSIIQAVLSSTGFDDAAANLAEHHCRRTILRTRVEVLKSDISQISDAVKLHQNITHQPAPWNKSKIINDLVAEYNFDITAARTIASIVEEKILASGFRCVPSVFIRFLVLMQAQAILSAQQQLQRQADEKAAFTSLNNAPTDGRLRQPQKGLCTVEVLPAVGAV